VQKASKTGASCATSRSRRASTPELYDRVIDLRRIAAGQRGGRRGAERRQAAAERVAAGGSGRSLRRAGATTAAAGFARPP
jgi:hypothetical protein